MSTTLSEQISELLNGVLSERHVGAELQTRQIQRGGVIQPSEVVINVSPDNPKSAAAMQFHVDAGKTIDLTLGNGTVLEFILRNDEKSDSLMIRLSDIASAVIAGAFREVIKRRHGEIGSAKGEIQTRSGVIRGSRYDTTVGWLFAKGETIQYSPYAPGTVRNTEGTPIILP